MYLVNQGPMMENLHGKFSYRDEFPAHTLVGYEDEEADDGEDESDGDISDGDDGDDEETEEEEVEEEEED
ncbi:hypothetical protein RUND412_004748 [Rhizina undulata]